MAIVDLLSKVKLNLILEHSQDDGLITGFISAAVSYAESYQHLEANYYQTHAIPPKTEQSIIVLSSHFYENRNGSTRGYFADNTNAAEQTWKTLNLVLRKDRYWKV